jgi:hypothetical protein
MRGPGGRPPHAVRALPETVYVHREGGRSAGLPEWRTQKTQIQESRVVSVPQAAARAAFEIAGSTSVVPARGHSHPRVDIRYVVTSLKGSAQHLYEDVYCQRGQMEDLIKLHKAQLASDRMSCHSATANQVRLVPHTAAFWLTHASRL